MSLPPFIAHERSLLCVNFAYGAHPDRVEASSFNFKLSTFNHPPHLYRCRNAAKMDNSSSPNGHTVQHHLQSAADAGTPA
jgi:hypothetical protein